MILVRLAALAALPLALSACGSTATSAAPPIPSANYTIASVTPANAGALLGMQASSLFFQFGRPDLQVPEGDSLMMQWRGPACILEAYLYPARGGEKATTHIEAADVRGNAVDRDACIRSLERR